ncbi:hypothetical protein BaRGS_00003986 [Batillaria attramentaria]|uniref:Ionotropic glutamate receptor L-glutamate and glycine-binding domain-containing protein n=1 Tax=Batillaria attramentaria TaxID=370345 RepID=A0ABD0M0P1_9CAEN
MAGLLLALMLQLGWKDTVIVTEETEDAESLQMNKLSEYGVQHVLVSGDWSASGKWVQHVVRTGADSWRPLSIVLLCSLSCVQASLLQASFMEKQYGTLSAFGMSSRWLLMPAGGDKLLDHLHVSNVTMDNVVLVNRMSSDMSGATCTTRAHSLGQKSCTFHTLLWAPEGKRKWAAWLNYIDSYEANGSRHWRGQTVDLINVASNLLNFTYDIVAPAVDVWGSSTEKDSSVGYFSHITNNDVDMGLVPIYILKERREIMDFTDTLVYSPYALVYRQPTTQNDMQMLLGPFSQWLLLAIGGAMVFVLTLLFAMEWGNFVLQYSQSEGASPRHSSGRLDRTGSCTWLSTLDKVFQIAGAVLLGTLTAFLSVTKDTQLFSSIEDLVRKEHDYTWGFINDSAAMLSIMNSNGSVYRDLWAGVQRFASKDADVLSENLTKLGEKVRSERFVAFVSKFVALPTFGGDCDVVVVEAGLPHATQGLTLPKGIQTLHATGILSKWTTKWFPRATCSRPSKHQTVISLTHVQGALSVVPVGVGLALIVLAAEILYVKLRRKNATQADESIQFDVYDLETTDSAKTSVADRMVSLNVARTALDKSSRKLKGSLD